MDQKRRIPQFDLLRIIACYGVVSIHASARLWYYLPIRSADFVITNGINSLSRFCVPMFLMISGALFLAPDREITLKKLWGVHILRLFAIYVLWSCIYGIKTYQVSASASFSAKELIKYMISGYYHLWFLPMLIGIYALIPILRKWIGVASKKDLQYFLFLFFAFLILKTTIGCFILNPELLEQLGNLSAIPLACSYAGYFVLGYYLYHIGIPEKWNHWLYLSFPVCCMLNVLISTWLIWRNDKLLSDFSNSFGLFTFFITISLFQFATRFLTDKVFQTSHPKFERALSFVSGSTLGIYVMHLLLIDLPQMRSIYDSLPPILSIPIVTMLCFLFSFIIATVLRKIPFVGKFLC